jgi:5-methylcytosine-specific restriction endonuclease McrA
MLRVDNQAEVVRLSWNLRRMFTGRYAVQSGRRLFDARWKQADIDAVLADQKDEPIAMLCHGKRMLWHFHDRFQWDDDGLSAEDVKALLLQRERQLAQKLQSARSLMHAEENGKPTRAPIPTELRRAVFERDGGRCVECGAMFDIQYDHVLPVALGGATTVENLQLLCAECNRRKSDSI